MEQDHDLQDAKGDILSTVLTWESFLETDHICIKPFYHILNKRGRIGKCYQIDDLDNADKS